MGPLKVTDAFCYICRGVLIEPVTLPCLHVFCLTCFEQSMQETSYSCPLCRRRISNWVRSVKRSSNLINVELWRQIKEQFKEQVQLKLKGEDDGFDQQFQAEFSVLGSTSKPGEVAEEFSKLLNDFRIENEKLKEAEELASKELILKLKEEEERQQQILEEKEKLRLQEDTHLAQKIQEEINKEVSVPVSPNNPKVEKKSIKGKKGGEKKTSKGPMDEFLIISSSPENSEKQNTLSPKSLKGSRSTSADSTDSIRLEMNLFRPIRKVRRTPPKQYPDGRVREINLTKVTPLKLTFDNLPPSSSKRTIIEGKKIHSMHSAFVDTNLPLQETNGNYEVTSKRLRVSSDDPDSGVLKDITLGENNDSHSGAFAQEDSTKKKTSSVKKSAQENFVIPSKIPKFSLGVQGSRNAENGNFETQDYLNYDSSIEEDLIEEQRRIEKIILQEQEDRKLALRLSREWESELTKKPQTRSMQKSTKNINKKAQLTLLESIASRTRNRQK